jgi:predicted CXXCH cytochrome family protein
MKLQTPNMKHQTHGGLPSWHLLFGVWMLVCGVWSVHAESIIASKHDLSAGGPGAIKAASEKEVCIFCHAPHKAVGQTPLWNHQLSAATYTPYSSTTLKATVGQPTGATKLCLSCHDGTVALGSVYNRGTPIAMANGVTTMPTGPSNFGTDLSHEHPVSFVYDSALVAAKGQLKDPSTLTGPVKLDHSAQMQCTACHDPHNNQYGKFLVMENTSGSTLCLTCHEEGGWSGSAHHNATAPAPAEVAAVLSPNKTASVKLAKAPSVGKAGCASCHVSHGAGSKQRLLKQTTEDQTCYTCHSATQTAKNIQSEFNKLSVHPVLTTQQLHDPREDAVNAARHVTCSDCHNTHAATRKSSPAPMASGSIIGVPGVNLSGGIVSSVTKEYELCFRCHADSVSQGPSRVSRQVVENNKRIQFGASAGSFHSVVSAGKSANVPSLIAPWTPGSLMKCTDCHNNDQSAAAGGTGPNGPHGSAYSPLLERQLLIADGTTESTAAYALCYKCHSRTTLLFGGAGAYANVVEMHRKHVVDDKIACTTCHDSHGVQGRAHLINFNTTYVSPNSGVIRYNSTGTFSGNCTLSCHGKDHQATPYSR